MATEHPEMKEKKNIIKKKSREMSKFLNYKTLKTLHFKTKQS